MRSNKPLRQLGIAMPLSVAFLISSVATPGCQKVEELTGKVAGQVADAADEAGDKDEGEGEGEGEGAEGGGGSDEVAPEPEPIPVEPMHSGLDLMLSFVPDDKAEFMIVRDASVLAEYVEEADRFFDGPMGKIEADPLGGEQDLKEMVAEYEKAKEMSTKVVDALASSGLDLKAGGALIKTGGKTALVFASDDPQAAAKVAEAMGEKVDGDECQAIADVEGWNVCSQDKATREGFKPAEDPTLVRKAVEERLPGVDLEEANIIFVGEQKGEPIAGALTTLPGLVHAAISKPKDKEFEQAFAALQPGEATSLASVQPGAGFIWARTNPEVLTKFIEGEMKGAPPEATKLAQSLNGEWLFAGSVKPGGLVLQAGMNDTSAFAPLLEMAMGLKGMIPPEIPDMPDAKLNLEKVAIEHEGTKADALHFNVSGIPEADLIKAFAGLHLDVWAFAAGNALTFAVGPDAEHVGMLMHSGESGPSEDTLASLPAPLAEALKKNEVSLAVHMPTDFASGAHLHKLMSAALKEVPEAKPEQLFAVMGLAAPFSSGTFWLAQPEGGEPVIHFAVQGIGNRSTDEGKEALDAAHAVADGADPAETFGPLAAKYGNSAMAFAYATRAGTEGPGSMVGSGLGAVAAMGAMAVPLAMGKRNAGLADDLGVKPEDPEPEVEIKTKPVAPKHEPIKEDPKPKPKPKPKADPKKDDPKKDDPKKDDPIVEPDKPKPPVPKPDPGKADPKKPKVDPRTDPRRRRRQ